MWKFQDFSATQILREINFGPFEAQKLPFWPFEQVWILNFWAFWYFQLWNVYKKSIFEASKIVKMQFLTFKNETKISCKIRVVGKSLNLHTVKYQQTKIPISLPMSVLTYECDESLEIIFVHIVYGTCFINVINQIAFLNF